MRGLRERIRKDPARTARQALALVVLLVSLAVAWSLWRPQAGALPVPSPPVAAGAGTTVADMDFVRFKDASRRVEVRAREMVRGEGDTMLLKGVDAALPFLSQGRTGTLSVTADECQYQPARERASFKGRVRMRTDDGVSLDTESLKYWGDQQRAFTADPVVFRRGSLSATALGFEYRAGSGVELRGDARVRIEGAPGQEPTEITSPSALASREERFVLFRDGTLARQGARELRSTDLRLDMDEAMAVVERATATGNVEAVSAAGAPPLPGAAASGAGAGTRRLRAARLEVRYRAAGVLEQALATGKAALEIEPGTAEAQERRRIEAPRLRFDFDVLGRFAALHGQAAPGARPGSAARCVLVAEPLTAAGVARRVESDLFTARVDPASGALGAAEFEGSVAFSEPGRKAWAGRAVHDAAAATLVLTADPRIADEAEGSELRGREIRVATATQAVRAAGNVRHSVAGRRGSSRPGPFGGREPTLFVCQDFEFDPATGTARYRENALVRSGSDEVRAPLITVQDPASGERSLRASGGVSSTMHPKPSKADAKAPAAVEARSREMRYEEAAARVVYTGEVEIRQGDIVTRSPEAVVLMSKDGETVDRLLAGEPVEVHQGVRRATGERGTYTPATETFVLTGERVVLFDVDRRLEGRILTFEVGSDRIRVDGREEVRTEAVFRRKEPARP